MLEDGNEDIFFGTEEAAPMPRQQVAAARWYCNQCFVKAECLEFAIRSDEEWGVWGGLSRPERIRAVEIYPSVDAIMDALDDRSLEQVVRRR